MGHVKNIHSRCLDAERPATNDGSLRMWRCEQDDEGQQWAYSRTTGQIQNIYGSCLDAPERNSPGSSVHMWECLPGEKNQMWSYDEATGQIKNQHGICLDAFQRDVDGGGVHMWDCLPEEPNQQWRIGELSLDAAHSVQQTCHTAQEGEDCYRAVSWAMNVGITSRPEWYPGLDPSSSFVDFQDLLYRRRANNDNVCPEPCRCHTAQEGEGCYRAVSWAMNVGINSRPEWYPGLDASSSFEDFQDLLYRRRANNDNVCPEPCRQPAPAPAPSVGTSDSAGNCSSLTNVVLPCTPDGCKAVVKRMSGSTCRAYCSVNGMTCAGAWSNRWGTCRVKGALTCDDVSDRSSMICECGAALTTTALPSATSPPSTTAATTTTPSTSTTGEGPPPPPPGVTTGTSTTGEGPPPPPPGVTTGTSTTGEGPPPPPPGVTTEASTTGEVTTGTSTTGEGPPPPPPGVTTGTSTTGEGPPPPPPGVTTETSTTGEGPPPPPPGVTTETSTTGEEPPLPPPGSPDRCSSVLDTLAGHIWSDTWYTCGERINWLRDSEGSSEEEAKVSVALEFPECEACWPWEKYKAPGDASLSPKRGIAIQDYLLSPVALANLASIVSWGYIWDFSPDHTWPSGGPSMAEWNAAGIRFVPMAWGSQQLGVAEQHRLPAGRRALLGFNEPNFQDQARLSPEEAASLWPRVEQLAAQNGINYLVSPAVNFNTDDDPIDWMWAFLRECSGCKIDAIAFHSYTCHGRYLKEHIDMYRVFGKPLWLTEFACSEAGRLSMEGQMDYLREAVPLLERDADVEMYAWFSYFQDEWKFPSGDVNGDAGLVYANASLSPLGQLYGSFASAAPIQAPEPWVPPTGSELRMPQGRDPREVPAEPASSTTTTTTAPVVSPDSPPDACHTAIAGEQCFQEVVWAMHEGVVTNPEWYPGLSPQSSFQDFQRFLHAKGHMEGICPVPCTNCHAASVGDRCYAAVTRALQHDIQARPERYEGLSASSSFEEVQAFFHRTGRAGRACGLPCSAPSPPDGGSRRCYQTAEGCPSVGVNVFGKDGFESEDAMRAAVDALFAKGVRNFRLVNVGAWQDAVMEAIDAAAARFGASDSVSLQLTSLFFESPATCPSLPAWQDFSLTTTAAKLARLKNIRRFLLQLDACSICPSSPLFCTNPTEQAFAQDVRFGSTATANVVSDFARSAGSNGYGPAHIVAAHRAFPRNVEFVVPYMNNAQSPMSLIEHVVGTYIAPLRAQGRKFHLEGTIYPFWTSSERAFAPFPAAQVHGFVSGASALGVDGFVVAETGWPEACPGANPAQTRPAELQMKCDYMASVLEEGERLAQASRANGDGELLTYLWKFGPADDGSSCGADGFGLFRRNGSFACSGRMPGWD